MRNIWNNDNKEIEMQSELIVLLFAHLLIQWQLQITEPIAESCLQQYDVQFLLLLPKEVLTTLIDIDAHDIFREWL